MWEYLLVARVVLRSSFITDLKYALDSVENNCRLQQYNNVCNGPWVIFMPASAGISMSQVVGSEGIYKMQYIVIMTEREEQRLLQNEHFIKDW